MLLPESIKNKRVIVTCFDWGKGHLYRCVSLFLQLEGQGNRLLFLGDIHSYELLKQYGFQGLFEPCTGSEFNFKGDGNFKREAIRNLKKGLKSVKNDRKKLAEINRQFTADFILSDHRYGMRLTDVPSVFITHQVQLPKGASRLANYVHTRWMKKFDSIWIMDDADIRLAKDLSENTVNGHYIGIHSRFLNVNTSETGLPVAIISGPEPYASQFQETILAVFSKLKLPLLLISGCEFQTLPTNITVVSGLQEADAAIKNARYVISRSGYTTLMDLTVLKKKAILFPTKGQHEQIYLAQESRVEAWKIVWNEAELVQAVLNLSSEIISQ